MEYNRQNDWEDVPAQAKVFAHEYAVAGNLTSACKRVSIGRAKGAQLLRDPLVRGYIDDLLVDDRQDSIISRSFVELQWLETLEQVNGDAPVANVTRDGDHFMAPMFNANAKVAVLKELSKFAGMNKDVGVDGHGVTINIDLGAAGYVKTDDSNPGEIEVGPNGSN